MPGENYAFIFGQLSSPALFWECTVLSSMAPSSERSHASHCSLSRLQVLNYGPSFLSKTKPDYPMNPLSTNCRKGIDLFMKFILKYK